MVTTGAEDDLKQVTELTRAMVMRWGMSPEIGLLSLNGNDEGNFQETGLAVGASGLYSKQTAQAIDQATRRIVDECYTKVLDPLTRERARLDGPTEALLREESLDEAQMRAATGLEDRPVLENAIAATR